MLKIAQTVGGADKSVSGVVFRGTKGNPVVTGFLPILWAYGGDVFDRAGNVTIDSREAQAALKTFLALKASAPKDVDVYGAAEVRDALQRHGRAVDRGLAGVVPALDDPKQSRVVGQIALQPPPGQTAGPAPMLGIWQMGIPKDAPHAKLAQDFLAYLTARDTQTRLAGIGIPPTRRSVFNDPALVRQYRWYPDQLKALEAGRAARVNDWQQVESILGDQLQLALTGRPHRRRCASAAEDRTGDGRAGSDGSPRTLAGTQRMKAFGRSLPFVALLGRCWCSPRSRCIRSRRC